MLDDLEAKINLVKGFILNLMQLAEVIGVLEYKI